MNNPRTIAVDIDDVLSDHASTFVAYSNKRWGTDLSVSDYDDHWARMWRLEHDDTELDRRIDDFYTCGILSGYECIAGSEATLRRLAKDYRLVIVTSRRERVSRLTTDWIEARFPGVFDDVAFSGNWDSSASGAAATKADICRQLKASYLVDDQLKHCLGVADTGIKAVLFGDYSWNTLPKLPPNITRCSDWSQVEEFFYGRD